MAEAALRDLTFRFGVHLVADGTNRPYKCKHMTQAALTTFGEQAMRADAKRRRGRDDADRDERERRRRQEEALDDALMNTFPASDPVSAEQPVRAS
jgi:hypothetical protein